MAGRSHGDAAIGLRHKMHVSAAAETAFLRVKKVA